MYKIFIALLICTFYQIQLQAQTVKAVKGSKVLVSLDKAKLKVSQGETYEIFQGGKIRGKVMIRKIGKRQALGQLLEGKAPGGGKLVRPGTKGISEHKHAIALGLVIHQPTDFSLDGVEDGDTLGYSFDLQRAIAVRYQYKINHSWEVTAGLRQSSGGGNLSLADAPAAVSSDLKYLQIDIGAILRLNHLFYLVGQTGYISGEATASSNTVAKSEFSGLHLGGGVGLEYSFTQSFFMQSEFQLQYNYLTSFDTSPTDISASGGQQITLGLAIMAGLKF